MHRNTCDRFAANKRWVNATEWMNNFWKSRIKWKQHGVLETANALFFGSDSKMERISLCFSLLNVAQMYSQCKTQKRITQIQKDEVHCDTIMKTWIRTAGRVDAGKQSEANTHYKITVTHSGQSKGTKFCQLISHATVWEWHCFRHCRPCRPSTMKYLECVFNCLWLLLDLYIRSAPLFHHLFNRSLLSVCCRPTLLSVEMQMNYLGSDLLNSPVLLMPLDISWSVRTPSNAWASLYQPPHFKYVTQLFIHSCCRPPSHSCFSHFRIQLSHCHCFSTIYKQL